MKYVYVYNPGYDETTVGSVESTNLHDATVEAVLALGEAFSNRWNSDSTFLVVPADRPVMQVTTQGSHLAIVAAVGKFKADRDAEVQRAKDLAELNRLRKLYPNA